MALNGAILFPGGAASYTSSVIRVSPKIWRILTSNDSINNNNNPQFL